MIKTLKNLLLQNQESFVAESGYIASVSQALPSSFKDDCRLAFDLLRQGQICVSIDLYRERIYLRLMARTYYD